MKGSRMKAIKGGSLNYVILALIFTLSACGGGGSDDGGSGSNDDGANAVPVANAGSDQNLSAGTVVTLNASASSDGDGDALTYRWALTSVPDRSTATLNNSNSVSPTFTADLDGTYVAQLVVNDGSENSSPDTVNIVAITVQPPNNLEANFNSRELSLTWDSVPGADSHSVYFAKEPGITTENYAAYDGGTWLRDVSSPLTIPQLQNNTGYFAVVTAVKSDNESIPSNEVAALVRDPNAVIAGRYKPIGLKGDVIFDIVHELEWKRCSVGQEWDLKSLDCIGFRRNLSWYEAVETYGSWDVIEDKSFLEKAVPTPEWRLPTIDQLATLQYCETGDPQSFGPMQYCKRRYNQTPAIIEEAFPNTSLYNYWSGSGGGMIGGRVNFQSPSYTYNSAISGEPMRLLRLPE